MAGNGYFGGFTLGACGEAAAVGIGWRSSGVVGGRHFAS
jgi:hypothetical protein